MLDHPAEVLRALVRYRDIFDPHTTSLLVVGVGPSRVGRDPFRGGFIAGMEERQELIRRLSLLDLRKRRLLFLWYVTGLPVTEIAKVLDLSRMHCYRLRNEALNQMTESDEQDAATTRA